MRHGVCYAIIRAFNLDSCTLRHLDRHLEESVERVRRVLPLAAILQRLATVHFIGADNAVRVQVRHLNGHKPPARVIPRNPRMEGFIMREEFSSRMPIHHRQLYAAAIQASWISAKPCREGNVCY